jgi:diguanylate cyclase (GGDEF)-like protein
MKRYVLFWPCLALIGLAILSGILLERALQHWFLDFTEAELTKLNKATKLQLERNFHDNEISRLDRIADELGELKPDFRITLIKKDGTVVGDTALTPSEIIHTANHANREEVKAALANGFGHATRMSSTTEQDLIYLAERFVDANFDGLVRSATSTKNLDDALWSLRSIMVIIFLGILILLIILMISSEKALNTRIEEQQQDLEGQVRTRTREIELLHRLANMLAACNSMKEAQQVVEDVIPRLLGDINGAISLIRSSRNQLEIKLDWGGLWPSDHVYSPDECWALRKGKYHLANDEHTHLPCQHMHQVGDDQSLCIPLIAHGNTIGIMHLYLSDHEFEHDKRQLAFTIAEHLGLALANLNLQDKLREQAIRDPLTGLYNRRYLEESLEHEIMRAKRREQCLSVLMMDIDHFKRFNDTFGHDAGDYVLKSLGSLLTDSIRGEDIVCRVGGEELAVILPETGPENADLVAAKLCDLVREFHLNFHNQSLGQLTISIGVATYPHQGDHSDGLMKAADVALYQAKEAGRDQFCHAAETTEKPMSDTKSLVEQILDDAIEPND